MAIKTLLDKETPASRVAVLRGWPGKDLARLPWSEAPCLQPGADPEDWFPPANPPGINPEKLQARLEKEARALCKGCPLADACLELAVRESGIEPGDIEGVWGGLAEHEVRDFVADERRERGMPVTTVMAVAA